MRVFIVGQPHLAKDDAVARSEPQAVDAPARPAYPVEVPCDRAPETGQPLAAHSSQENAEVQSKTENAPDDPAAEAARRAEQQRAIAELGQAALTRMDIDVLLGQTCALVESVLGLSRCSIVARMEEKWECRCAVGIPLEGPCADDDPSHASLFEYTLNDGRAVTFRALPADPRFDGQHFVDHHGVVAGASVRIPGRVEPFGVLTVLTTEDRDFEFDELEFLEAIADLTGAMIESSRTERALAESEQRFRSLVESSSDGIMLTDEDGAVRFAGPSICRLTGFEDRQLAGRRIVDLVHPDDQEKMRRIHAQILSSPYFTVKDELRMRHAGGSWIHVEAVAQNLLHDPAVHALVINYRAVSPRRSSRLRSPNR